MFHALNQDIIRLPRLFRFLQKPLAKLISVFRAPKSKEGYASIGGGSPLRKITDEQVHSMSCQNACVILVSSLLLIVRVVFWSFLLGLHGSGFEYKFNYDFCYLLQADALKMALEAKNMPVNVYVGMRYWYPFTEEAIQQVSTLFL